MKKSQYYGGSAEEARHGRECYQLRERAIRYGFVIRREEGKVIIVINTPLDVTEVGDREAQ
jgi:hypothetical protein